MAGCISLLLVWLYLAGSFCRLEWMLFDKRASFYAKDTKISSQIAVVMIDEASLLDMNAEFGRFPWPREVYGDFIEFFSLGGARAVVFDLLLTENDNSTTESRKSDRVLIEATREYGIAYHAAQIIADVEDEIRGKSLDRPMPEDFSRVYSVKGKGYRRGIHNNFSLPFSGLYQVAKGIGVVGMDADNDGVYRRIRLFREYQGLLYPALPVAPLLDGMIDNSPPVFTDKSLTLGSTVIPIDGQENYLIKPYGVNNEYSASGVISSLRHIAAGEIEELLINPEEFIDKIVFVGASAVGLEDIKTTPLSTKTPGVLMHAWAAANILENDFLRPVSRIMTVILIIVFSMLTIVTIFNCENFICQVSLPLLYGGGFFYWAFSRFDHGVVYDIAPPVMALALSWLVSFAYLSFTEGREKRKVRKLFSRYVSPKIMTELLARQGEASLGEVGETLDMTVLFSDIRGFTSISEVLSAPEVVDLLNCHFGHMTEVIFNRSGTLDKFIGDALMAFWGAPLKVEDHAGVAVMAALEMRDKLIDVNRDLLARGYQEIDIGIGINSGKLVLGNIGSARKMDYTVIGDNVNLASRLEGLTKNYGLPILISEYTLQKMEVDVPVMIVDLVRVKGKQKPIRIYSPLTGLNPSAETLAKCRAEELLAQQAFELYQSRKWHEAVEAYQMLVSPLSVVFSNRCLSFIDNPPPDDWDGSNNLNLGRRETDRS